MKTFDIAFRTTLFVLIVLAIAFASSGCAVNTRVTTTRMVEPVYEQRVLTHQHESFLKLVLFVKNYHGSKPTEDLVLTAQTHVYNAGLVRTCRKRDCFFVYNDKEIVIHPEYIEIRKIGSRDYVKFYNMEVAMRIVYNLKGYQ